jgi:hypothetical protein
MLAGIGSQGCKFSSHSENKGAGKSVGETPYGDTAQTRGSVCEEVYGCAALRTKVKEDFAPAVGVVDVGLADPFTPHVFFQKIGSGVDDSSSAPLAGAAMTDVVEPRFSRCDCTECST